MWCNSSFTCFQIMLIILSSNFYSISVLNVFTPILIKFDEKQKIKACTDHSYSLLNNNSSIFPYSAINKSMFTLELE